MASVIPTQMHWTSTLASVRAGRAFMAATDAAVPSEKTCSECGRPESEWPMTFRGTGVCSDDCRKKRDRA